jgi:hypothetical protein
LLRTLRVTDSQRDFQSPSSRQHSSPLVWEDSHEAIERSSMETALTVILSSETGSYVALRRASLHDGTGRARWNIFHSRLHLRDELPAHQND